MSSKDTMRIMAQFKKAIKEPNEFIKFSIDEDNPYIWFILIHNISGNNDEYVGGEFIFEIKLPNNFPYSPPTFYAKTENGLYTKDKKCCISIGEYHADDYRTGLGVAGFARELANGLINWKDMGHGINLIDTTVNEKKKLSKDSINFNKTHNSHIMEMIESQYRKYSKQWDKSKIPNDMQIKLGIDEESLREKEED